MTTAVCAAKKHRHMSSGKSVRVGLIRQTTAWGMVAHESLGRVLSDASRKLELCSTKRNLTGHSIKRRSDMGPWRNWERYSLAGKRLRVPVPSVPPQVNGFTD